MSFILNHTKIKASLFDGRGYLLSSRNTKRRHGIAAALESDPELYASRDAVLVLRQWLTLWKGYLEKGGKRPRDISELTIGGINFINCDAIELLHSDANPIAMVDAVLANLTTGFTEPVWRLVANHPLEVYETPSLDKPWQMIQLNMEPFSVAYSIRINGVEDGPVLLRDLTMIRTAEALLSIANTQTHPQTGYHLELKLGFGTMELAELNRDQMRDMALRLIP